MRADLVDGWQGAKKFEAETTLYGRYFTNGTKFLVVAPFPISLASLAWDHRDFLSTNYSPATLLRP